MFLNLLFAVRIRCWIYLIWDALAEIIYKSRIISWCEERNPMWWLSSIPASCEEIGCMVRQCLFHLGINPMWCGSSASCGIAQSQPLPIRWRLVLCLLYRRYFVKFSSDLPIVFCSWFALSQSDAIRHSFFVRLPIGCCLLLAFSSLISVLHNRSIHICKLDLEM